MKLGIIQGRLSKPTEGFQECPTDWKREFLILETLKLNHIEWIVTKKSFNNNPLFNEDLSKIGVEFISKPISNGKVKVAFCKDPNDVYLELVEEL